MSTNQPFSTPVEVNLTVTPAETEQGFDCSAHSFGQRMKQHTRQLLLAMAGVFGPGLTASAQLSQQTVGNPSNQHIQDSSNARMEAFREILRQHHLQQERSSLRLELLLERSDSRYCETLQRFAQNHQQQLNRSEQGVDQFMFDGTNLHEQFSKYSIEKRHALERENQERIERNQEMAAKAVMAYLTGGGSLAAGGLSVVQEVGSPHSAEQEQVSEPNRSPATVGKSKDNQSVNNFEIRGGTLEQRHTVSGILNELTQSGSIHKIVSSKEHPDNQEFVSYGSDGSVALVTVAPGPFNSLAVSIEKGDPSSPVTTDSSIGVNLGIEQDRPIEKPTESSPLEASAEVRVGRVDGSKTFILPNGETFSLPYHTQIAGASVAAGLNSKGKRALGGTISFPTIGAGLQHGSAPVCDDGKWFSSNLGLNAEVGAAIGLGKSGRYGRWTPGVGIFSANVEHSDQTVTPDLLNAQDRSELEKRCPAPKR